MRTAQALRLARFAFIRCMNRPYRWLPAASGTEDRLPWRIEAAGSGGGRQWWGGGAGRGEREGREEVGSLLAWFFSAQVFAILSKCAVSVLSSFSAETSNDAEQGNKVGPLWALVLLDGPTFGPRYKKTIAWEH